MTQCVFAVVQFYQLPLTSACPGKSHNVVLIFYVSTEMFNNMTSGD